MSLRCNDASIAPRSRPSVLFCDDRGAAKGWELSCQQYEKSHVLNNTRRIHVPEYSFPNSTIDIRGAVEVRRTADGVSPVRLPLWAERQVPDDFMRFDVGAAAGVHLAFDTEATSIELEAMFTRIDVSWTILVPTSIDLVVDGLLVESVPVVEGPILRLNEDLTSSVVGNARSRIQFSLLGAGAKRVEVWLPHAALVELISLTTNAVVVHPDSDTRSRWVHHGSSISHCLETTSPITTWPAIAARVLGFDGINLGFAGEAMLDPFVAKAIRDIPAALISLKVGVNIVGGQTLSPRGFLSAAHGYLDTIREKQPVTPIILISAIHCPVFENAADDGPLTIEATRDILKKVVATRADDPNLHYLDGRRLLGSQEADMLPDDLHPSPEGYRRMGKRFAAHVARAVITA